MSFRGLPVRPRKGGSGTVTQSSDAEIPGNMRVLGEIKLFLASVGFRELPWDAGLSTQGVGYGEPKSQR